MRNGAGREKLGWDATVWSRIDDDVQSEVDRTSVAAKFLPIHKAVHAAARTVAADAMKTVGGILGIDEASELPFVENSVPFVLTKQQYEDEETLATAATLATRAANILAGDLDRTVFQGGKPTNLIQTAESTGQIVNIPIKGKPGAYGENTFTGVAAAYATLQDKRHYGPYALVMSANEFADAYAPLPSTLIMPADRIKPLTGAGFYGTGTVPPRTGLMTSTGGKSLDLAVSMHASTTFVRVADDETYLFRVYHRFVLRVKDPTAVVLLRFAAD